MKIQFVISVFLAFFLTSCFDIVESFTFNEDGSGVYEQQLDFGNVYKEMLAKIKEIEKVARPNHKHTPEKMDSLVYYKSKLDTITGLSINEKKILITAYAKLFCNEENGAMYLLVSYPFNNTNEFELLQRVLKKDNGKYGLLEDLSTEMFYNGNYAPPDFIEMGQVKPSLRFPISNFLYTFSANAFSRKIQDSISNKEIFEIENRFFKGLTNKKISLQTIIKLPNSSRNVAGNNAQVSTNKKIIKFSTEIEWNEFDASKKINFWIDY